MKIPLSKRKYFEQEKEIRLLYSRETTDEQKGISFPINIGCLIEEVRVYPSAPKYFLEVVNKELKSAGILIKALDSEI